MPLSASIKKTLLISSLLVSSVYAGNFPRGCEVSGFGYNSHALILNESGDQAYYLVQNRSNSQIELERHEVGDAFMSPPLHAALDPMNWAAFASDVKNLNFKCYKREADNATEIDCQEALDVCRYPRVRFALSNMGNYWISANKSQNDVIQDSVAKGIYLKW